MKNNYRGFTLIELLVVVAILGILASVGVVSYQGYTWSAQKKSVELNLNSILLSNEEYTSDNGEYYYSTTCNTSEYQKIQNELLDGKEVLKELGNDNTVNEQVKKLAMVAKEMEVGIVCSGHEAKFAREILGSNSLIFTPGIRMNEENKNDQKRICTPSESIKNGANKIIMGRSLIVGDIEENIKKVSNSIK